MGIRQLKPHNNKGAGPSTSCILVLKLLAKYKHTLFYVKVYLTQEFYNRKINEFFYS